MEVADHVAGQDTPPVFGNEDQVNVQRRNYVSATPVIIGVSHRPIWHAGYVAIRNRLYPDPAQVPVLARHSGHARFVWNLCVEQQSWWWPGRAAVPGDAQRQRQLAEARRAEPWLAAGSSSVQQQALRDFDRAMAAFFDKDNPAGKPSFRSKRGVQGFVIRDTRARRLNRRWGEVQVPKCGWVRFRWTRPLPGKLGAARVTLDGAGHWHVSFPAPQPGLARQPAGRAIGADRGVRTALVTSDGQHYRAPRISDRQAARYVALQRRMARQHKKSRKRERTRRAMAVIAADVTRRRQDWAEKISTRFVVGNDVIVLEKLNTTGMTRKPRPKPDPDQAGAFLPNQARAKASLSRGILASCWGALATRLEQKAAASGAAVVQINPRFTSQQCHACGHTTPENRDSQAVFRCVKCGHEDHADANAAKNILARGLLLTTGEIVPAHAPGHGAYALRKTAQSAAAETARNAA
jgi:transposase